MQARSWSLGEPTNDTIVGFQVCGSLVANVAKESSQQRTGGECIMGMLMLQFSAGPVTTYSSFFQRQGLGLLEVSCRSLV